MTDKPYHHGNLRDSLIEAGMAFVNREGEKQLSLRKVAALCGVSQAAPYSHFSSKEDLMAAMRDYVTERFMRVLHNSIESYPDLNDPRRLIEMGRSYVLFFIEHPQYFSFLFTQPCFEVNLSLDDEGASNYPPFQLLKTVAIPVLEALGIPHDKWEDSIISMWATVHGLASIATMKNVTYGKSWETKLEDLIWNK
jgi:AcrR family transcriptional regulator